MWLTHFWHSWSQFFIFAWDVTAGGILRTGVLICLVNPVFKSCKPPGQFNSGEWCGAFTLFSTHRRWSRLPRCNTNENLAHNTHRQLCGPTRLATNGEYFRILDVYLRPNHLYVFYEMFSAFLWWWNTIVWLILIVQITHGFLLE